MRLLSLTHAVLLLASACASPPQLSDSGPPMPDGRTEACTVTRISDGDSIECEPIGRVRLIGIDAPELNQPPFGGRSAAALGAHMPVGSQVLVESGVERMDQFGRILGHVWLDGQLVNWWMVRHGWAILLTYPPNVKYVDWLRDALRDAQGERTGLWGMGGFECPPVQRRRQLC